MASRDLFPLDLATWTERTPEVVEAVFGEGGVLSRHVPGFRPEPAQSEYALVLARLAVRGAAPGNAGRVALVEAGTGVGKTVAYLVVGLVTALLTGKRLMVSTFTRQLQFQVVGDEADLAVKVVAEILGSADGATYRGRAITVAPRRSRSAFVSPGRAEKYADELAATGEADEAAEAMRAYARMARAAIGRVAAGEARAVVDELDGLTESFNEENPALADVVADLPPERYNLQPSCDPSEQVVWKAYLERANAAVAVAVTHAALVIDMSLNGRLSKARDHGFALVVVDEAHALERAARSAFGVKRSIAEMERDANRMRVDIAATEDLTPQTKATLDSKAKAYGEAARRLGSSLGEDVAGRGHLKHYEIEGGEAWLPEIDALRKATISLFVSLVAAGNVPFAFEASERLNRYDEELEWVQAAIRHRRDKGGPGLFRPVVSLTPVREDPCLQVVPVHGQRVVSRIWGRGKEGARDPMADAVAFTSATLAMPGREGWDAYSAMAWTLGVDREALVVEPDLCRRIEPAEFGRPSFVWADPRAEAMTREGKMTERGAAYAALAVAAAAGRPNPRTGHARQVVLTTNFADPETILAALPDDLRARTVARPRGQSLAKAVERWKAIPDGILITPGAFEGLNLPGLIDHLHLPRLPFPPRPETQRGRDDFAGIKRHMLQDFRQGLGRPVRRAADSPTIWVTDNRVPPPEAVQARERVFASHNSESQYLSAFPTRYRRAMNRGEILPCPEPLRRDRATAAPAPETV